MNKEQTKQEKINIKVDLIEMAFEQYLDLDKQLTDLKKVEIRTRELINFVGMKIENAKQINASLNEEKNKLQGVKK